MEMIRRPLLPGVYNEALAEEARGHKANLAVVAPVIDPGEMSTREDRFGFGEIQSGVRQA
jgi:hypothetical protein